MADFLSRLASGLGRGVEILGTLGTADLFRERALNERRQLGNIIAGQSIPAFARAGGAEPDSPENIRDAQLAQLATLGTPEALDIIGKLSPMNQSPEKTKALGYLSSVLSQQYGLPTEQVNAMLMGGIEPTVFTELYKKPELPSDLRTLGYLMQNPDMMESYKSIFGPAATNINVNTADSINNVAQKEAAKKYGEGMGNLTIDRLKQASEASSQNLQLDLMQDALTRGAKTGFGQDSIATIKNAYTSLTGAEAPEGLAPTELVRSFGNQFALRLRNPDSGLGLPGATSNRDIQFLQSMSPSLINSPKGNQEIIGAYKKINKFKVDLAKEQSRIVKENQGNIPVDLETQLQDYVTNYEILTPQEKARMEAVKEIGYISPEEVGKAYERGEISKEEAKKFLNKLGMK